MTNPAVLDDLIEMLEKCTEPDRILDADLLAEFNREHWEAQWALFNSKLAEALANGLTNRNEACWRYAFSGTPQHTSSIDAAVALVTRTLPIHSLQIHIDPSGEGADLTWWPKGLSGGEEHSVSAVSSDAAIAICLCVLRAIRATGGKA